MELNSNQQREIKFLKVLAGIVLTWLIVLILGCVSFGTALLAGLTSIFDPLKSIVVCLVGGTLGSSVSALISAAERVALGWEFSGGVKFPEPDPENKDKAMFVARMTPFFLARPFLGSAVGLVFYAGLAGGYLIAIQGEPQNSFSHDGLMFLSFLVGLMAKTFLVRLRGMFDALFGKQSKDKTRKASN